jgi:hypothetical protein
MKGYPITALTFWAAIGDRVFCSAPRPTNTGSKAMSLTEVVPSLYSVAEIGVLACSLCGKPMRFSCIEPDQPGFDIRTFECAKCNSTVKFAVSI